MKRRLLVLAVFFALFVTFVGLSEPAIVQAACPITSKCAPAPVSSNGGPGILFNDGRINNNDPWETSAIYCMADGSVRVYVIGNPWHIAFTASADEIVNSRMTPPGPLAGQSGFGSASLLTEHEGIYYYFSHNSQSHTLLISHGMGARLYRLPNGMLQVTSPGLNPNDGEYSVIFMECPGLPEAPRSMAIEVDKVRIPDVIDISFGTSHGGGGQQASGVHGTDKNHYGGLLTITRTLSKDKVFSD